MALRQANRNRVAWKGWGSKQKTSKGRSTMRESGAGRLWIPQEYDPEYTPKRDVTPTRARRDKVPHASDRCDTSLRVLWECSEQQIMDTLIDGGFLADACLDKHGQEVGCKGILHVQYSCSGSQHNRKLHCSGVPEKQRHRCHWLLGSVFQGHRQLDAKDVAGILSSFGASKTVDATSIDTGLNRTTVGLLFDKLRMASALVARDQRESLVFSHCQVEADETVVRKEKEYRTNPDRTKTRIGTTHHNVICLTQRGSTKCCMYVCEPKFVPVDEKGKPSPPAPPSTALVLPMLAKHLGEHVVLHTDGAEAYAAACALLQEEGCWATQSSARSPPHRPRPSAPRASWSERGRSCERYFCRLGGCTVVQDNVSHGRGQYVGFGRHDVTGQEGWETCEFAIVNDKGKGGSGSPRAPRRQRGLGGISNTETLLSRRRCTTTTTGSICTASRWCGGSRSAVAHSGTCFACAGHSEASPSPRSPTSSTTA